jgi:hypothetical protein
MIQEHAKAVKPFVAPKATPPLAALEQQLAAQSPTALESAPHIFHRHLGADPRRALQRHGCSLQPGGMPRKGGPC